MSFLLSVLAGLLSSALWECARDPLFNEGFDIVEPTDWEDVVRSAVDTSRPPGILIEARHRDVVAPFLESAEIRNLVRQIYYTRVDRSGVSLAAVRQAFAAIWGARFGRDIAEVDPYALFDLLVAACEQSLDRAIFRDTSLAAHEAKSAARHHAVSQRLMAIEKQLKLLIGAPTVAPDDLDVIRHALASVAVEVHKSIYPPSLHGTREVALDDLYVPPRLTIRGNLDSTDYGEVFNRHQRLVVLGNPGAGKTTLLQRLSLDQARQTLSGVGSAVVVIVVGLNEYSQELRRSPTTIHEYLSAQLASKYQVTLYPHVLEYLLLAGQVAIGFDGLDELSIVSQRRDIVKNIEAFVTRYPQARIIVTSRVVGYEHASLDRDRFVSVQLADFDAVQIGEYATKWFSLDERLSATESEDRADDFLRESESVPDLRANPLLLGLMCNLYRGRGFIPRNRPEVYEKCATMLFEAWDAQRDIDQLRPFEDLLRPTIRHLAFWIYSNEQLQAGVMEDAARQETQRFLAKWRFGGDYARAERAARGFIDFCRGRAWVFSDLGTDPQDHTLFQFTHRTFLEFFAAEQVVQDHETTQELIGVIRPHVALGEWETVTQLALQMQQSRHLGAADTILRTLLPSGKVVVNDSYVLFCARSLQSVVPRPETVSLISNAVLASIAQLHPKLQDDDEESIELLSLYMGEWLRCDEESRATVMQSFNAAIAAWLGEDDDSLRDMALQLVCGGAAGLVEWAFDEEDDRGLWWISSFQAMQASFREDVLRLGTEGDKTASYLACRAGWMKWKTAMQRHGLDFLWHKARIYLVSGQSFVGSVIAQRTRTEVTTIARVLAQQSGPWFSGNAISEFPSILLRGEGYWSDAPRSTLGMRLLLMAAVAELAADRLRDAPRAALEVYRYAEERARFHEDRDEVAPLTVRTVLGRGDASAIDEITDGIRSAGVDNVLAGLLEQWLKRDCEFVASSSR
jgi:NACHT domain-containing protein